MLLIISHQLLLLTDEKLFITKFCIPKRFKYDFKININNTTNIIMDPTLKERIEEL